MNNVNGKSLNCFLCLSFRACRQGQKGFLFSKEHRADKGAHELSDLWCRGLLWPELKADKISPCSFEVKNAWRWKSIPQHVFMAWGWRSRLFRLFKNQDRICSYNVTCRRVRATIVAVENQELLHVPNYVCSLRYPAWNAQTPYCHLWPARLYNIFPHYVMNSTILGNKKILNTKCVFWFSLQICLKISHCMKKWERYKKCT